MRFFCKEETFVVMIFVVPPAGLILYHVVRSWSYNKPRLQMVAEFVGKLQVSFDLIVDMLLLIFRFECAAQVFLKLFLFGMVAIMGLQVREGFMELTHEDLIVGLAKV